YVSTPPPGEFDGDSTHPDFGTTSDQPFIISTPAHLQRIAAGNPAPGYWGESAFWGGYFFELSSDITAPVGFTIPQFAGVFYGAGHTITFQGTNGLFGRVRSPAVIRDLDVIATIDGGFAPAIGGIANVNEGTLERVRLLGASSISGNGNVGGLVGLNTSGVSGSQVYDEAEIRGASAWRLFGNNEAPQNTTNNFPNPDRPSDPITGFNFGMLPIELCEPEYEPEYSPYPDKKEPDPVFKEPEEDEPEDDDETEENGSKEEADENEESPDKTVDEPPINDDNLYEDPPLPEDAYDYNNFDYEPEVFYV
ncbi:MAG: hypothetical protein FWC16_06705, partial [Defluviitaleaceae bacterium]|nr:hypothetical protein [Defluviitaleaceae bacterium]